MYTPLKAPVVAAMRVVWVGDGHWVVCSSVDLLGQRRQDLGALGGVEGGNARRLGDCGALEGGSQLLGDGPAGQARCSRQHALRGGGLGEGLPDEAGAHDGCHCSDSDGQCRAESGGQVVAQSSPGYSTSTTMPRIQVLTFLAPSLARGRDREVP